MAKSDTLASLARYEQAPFDRALQQQIVRAHGVSDLLAQLLAIRNIPVADVPRFLSPKLRDWLPDPFHLKDMGKAVDRLVKAIDTQETVAVFADYDVDGATSAAMLIHVLRAVGLEPIPYIPDRIAEGYGPNITAFHKLKDERGATLIVTLDCGAVAYEPLAEAARVGLDVIVIDHHLGGEVLPEAVAVVNPNRADESSECTTLCAAGVCFLLCVGLLKRIRETDGEGGLPDLLQLLDLAALGTVCDVMPLTGLNRAFVAQGLKKLSQNPLLGLQALAEIAAITPPYKASHFGFALGPRINAGGRVGEASLGVRLLISEDFQEARQIAERLSLHNRERQALEATMVEEALHMAAKQSHEPVIVITSDRWHPGVIGIVAGRIKERFYKPTCVIALHDGVGKGSARSIRNVHLGQAIGSARDAGLLLAGGGHAMAAGFTVEEKTIPALTEYLRTQLSQEVSHAITTRAEHYELALPLNALTTDLAHEMQRCAPFGMGNSEPRILLEDVTILNPEILKQKHVRCILTAQYGMAQQGSVSAIAFSAMQGDLGAKILNASGKKLSVIGTLNVDEWNQKQRASVHIESVF